MMRLTEQEMVERGLHIIVVERGVSRTIIQQACVGVRASSSEEAMSEALKMAGDEPLNGVIFTTWMTMRSSASRISPETKISAIGISKRSSGTRRSPRAKDSRFCRPVRTSGPSPMIDYGAVLHIYNSPS